MIRHSFIKLYILDAHGEPQPVDDVLTWGRWFEDHNAERIVKQTQVGDTFVSSVFLGLDHRWGMGGPPLLFETLVFGGKRDGEMWRYPTKEAAFKGHETVVDKIDTVDEDDDG